jgi:tetratricopeptide (TPR) repeat protein
LTNALALPGIGSTSLFEDHVHSLNEELFQALDSMLQKAWSLFYYHMASTNLQPIVQGLLQAGQLLLQQARSTILRQRASAFLSGVFLLTGRIALDQTGVSLAVHAYQEALSYARDATSAPLESLVIARIGGDLHEHHPQKALSLLSEARRLYSSTSAQLDQKLHAWIALHEAEAYAKLQQKQRCLTALGQAENLELHEAADPFWTAVDPALLWGFKGACLLTLGEPALAAEALERAKQLAAPSRRQQAMFSTDLALARAYQGEIEMACAAGEEALLLLLETRSSRGLMRLQQLLPVLSQWSGEACVQRWWSTWREGAALLGHLG